MDLLTSGYLRGKQEDLSGFRRIFGFPAIYYVPAKSRGFQQRKIVLFRENYSEVRSFGGVLMEKALEFIGSHGKSCVDLRILGCLGLRDMKAFNMAPLSKQEWGFP